MRDKATNFFLSQNNSDPGLFDTLDCETCSPQLFEFFCLVYVRLPSGLFMNSCGVDTLQEGTVARFYH